MADFLTEDRRRTELRLQDTEAARVAHRGDQLRAGQIRPHWRGDDRTLDPKHVAECGFHGHSNRLTTETAECSQPRRMLPVIDRAVVRAKELRASRRLQSGSRSASRHLAGPRKTHRS